MTTETSPTTLELLTLVAERITQLDSDLRAARELRRKLVRTGGVRYTVAELAIAAGVSEPTVTTMLRGR